MFILAELQDVVRVEPWRFAKDMNEVVTDTLNNKLANKVSLQPRGTRNSSKTSFPPFKPPSLDPIQPLLYSVAVNSFACLIGPSLLSRAVSPPQVMHNVGLCIALYDIAHVGDSYVFPGDGASHTKGSVR